jgi:hypothetical protein
VGNATAAPLNARADFKKLLRVVFIQSLYLSEIVTLLAKEFQQKTPSFLSQRQ